MAVEYRKLGRSGFSVPALSFGTATFGGAHEMMKTWGTTDVSQTTRLVDICLDAGLNMFDSANVYSDGVAEEILGAAIRGRRRQVIVSTKVGMRTGPGANDAGASRHALLQAVEGSLRRLGTDYIDLLQLHEFDAITPMEETLGTLNDLVWAGKVRYIGASNYSGWHLMKSLATSERHGWARYVAHQAFYSLANRDYELELLPLGLDQEVAAIVWSPLAWGRLTGKFRRGQASTQSSRLDAKVNRDYGPQVEDEHLYTIIDAIDEVAVETGKTVTQIALNWLLQRPTIASVIIGARDEEQLKQNLGAVGWKLTAEQMTKLDAASASKRQLPYPYWHQRAFAGRNPTPV